MSEWPACSMQHEAIPDELGASSALKSRRTRAERRPRVTSPSCAAFPSPMTSPLLTPQVPPDPGGAESRVISPF